MRVGLFISNDIKPNLPLYCRNMSLVQSRLEHAFVKFGYVVVHNHIYADKELMYASEDIDIVVLVASKYPNKIVSQLHRKTLVISFDCRDISLYQALGVR